MYRLNGDKGCPRARRGGGYLDVVLEDVGGAADGRHVVHDELAVGGQEVAPLVQLLDASLVLSVCKARPSGGDSYCEPVQRQLRRVWLYCPRLFTIMTFKSLIYPGCKISLNHFCAHFDGWTSSV